MNAQSSRSHAIVMLTVVKRKRMPPGDVDNANTGQLVQVGRLFLVDLAGSERLKKSGSQGAVLDVQRGHHHNRQARAPTKPRRSTCR